MNRRVLLLSVGAALLAADVTPAAAGPAGAVSEGDAHVLTTGNHSELIRTLPITRKSGNPSPRQSGARTIEEGEERGEPRATEAGPAGSGYPTASTIAWSSSPAAAWT